MTTISVHDHHDRGDVASTSAASEAIGLSAKSRAKFDHSRPRGISAGGQVSEYAPGWMALRHHPVDREEHEQADDQDQRGAQDGADRGGAVAGGPRRGRVVERRGAHVGSLLEAPLDGDEGDRRHRREDEADHRHRAGIAEIVEAEGLHVDRRRQRHRRIDRAAAGDQPDQRELLHRIDEGEHGEQREARPDAGQRDMQELAKRPGAVEPRRLVELLRHRSAAPRAAPANRTGSPSTPSR